MPTENESFQILNNGVFKYSKEQVKIIRDLIISLATIEYEHQKQYTNN